jgi:ATP-binding cassette, subfamily B, bacterial MsbA
MDHHKRGKRSTWSKFKSFLKKSKRILKYAKPQWKLMLFLFVVSAFFSLLSLAGPYLIKILLDDIIPNKDYGLLLNLMALFIVIFVVKTLVGIYHSYKTTYFVDNLVFRVKQELFDHLEHLDLDFYNKRPVGDIIYRLDEDVYGIDSFISLIVNEILMDVLTAVFILIICLKLDWKVTLISLCFFPFYLLTQKYFGDKIRKQKQLLIKKSSDLLSFIEENITSIRAIKSFVMESKKLDTYTKKNKYLIKQDLKMDLLESYAGSVMGIITFTPLLIILWYGSYQVMTGALTLGSLIAIYTYVGKLFDPIESLGGIHIAIQSTMVSVNRVFEFMDKKPKVQERKNAKPIRDLKGHVRFDDVSFYYKKGESVLEHITFDIKPGEMVGVVGPSGAGKSTLANLLLRFYEPTSGRVMVDGKDIREYTLASYRGKIGIVNQQPILFRTTILENIKFANPTATVAEVMRAARLAQIHHSITRLEKGYYTVVGTKGDTLSGGEKQRVAIARVILRDPSLIMLDEATSNLDSTSEQRIQKAMDHVSKGRTTFVIAHRLSTLRNADKIVVLDGHHLVEQGTFDQLMKQKGVFRTFYQTQFQE